MDTNLISNYIHSSLPTEELNNKINKVTCLKRIINNNHVYEIITTEAINSNNTAKLLNVANIEKLSFTELRDLFDLRGLFYTIKVGNYTAYILNSEDIQQAAAIFTTQKNHTIFYIA